MGTLSGQSMEIRALLCWGVLLCVLLFSTEATSDDSAASKTISADDFLKRLHLSAPHHQTQRTVAAVHPLRRTNRVSLNQGEVVKSERQPSPLVQKHVVQIHRDSESGDLGEGSSVQADSAQSAWQLHITKPKPQERKQLLAQAKEHFPATELQISDLRKQLGEHHTAVGKAELVVKKSKRDYERKLGEAQKVESVHEFDMMTNPKAEQAAMKADSGLQALHHVSDDAEAQLAQKKSVEKVMQKKLSDKLNEREVNIKAVKLFGTFKKQYEKKLSAHLATVSAEFHHKAMTSALKLAKKKYSEMKKPFEEKQAALKKQQQAAKADLEKQRAEEKAEMDAKEKSDARAMFQAYVQRFHEMQQSTAAEEVEQDLGESESVSDNSPVMKKKAEQKAGVEGNEENKLDDIMHMIGDK